MWQCKLLYNQTILFAHISDLIENSPAILSDIEIQTKHIASFSIFDNVDLEGTLNRLNLSLDAFSVQHLIGAQAMILPKPRPLCGLLGRRLD